MNFQMCDFDGYALMCVIMCVWRYAPFKLRTNKKKRKITAPQLSFNRMILCTSFPVSVHPIHVQYDR